MKPYLPLLTTAAITALLTTSGCDESPIVEEKLKLDTLEVTSIDTVYDTTLVDTTCIYNTPKYVFLFIGDGMAMPQVNATEAALGMGGAVSRSVGISALTMSGFPVLGQATTHAEDRYITGSAAAGTALATGKKTTIGTISMNGDHTDSLQTIAQMAKAAGQKVGIISSVSIDHATPACFYAHAPSRSLYWDIAAQMPASGVDYFGGGFAKGDAAKYNHNGEIVPAMQSAGYTVTTNRNDLAAATGKVWAYTTYDASMALNYEIDRNSATEMSLAEFTKEGIRLLDNDKGFFMMVEGGKIDWAGHANDAVANIYDMIAFDNAVKEAVAFYQNKPDSTLIIVTGDHETGGLSIGYAGTGYETSFEVIANQTLSYQGFDELLYPMIAKTGADSVTFEMMLDTMKLYFGLDDVAKDSALALSEYELARLQDAYSVTWGGESGNSSTDDKLNYGGYTPLTVTATHILNNKAGLDWTSYKHTSVTVPVYAMGQGQHLFTGSYDNTDVAKKIMAIAKLK